MREECPPQILPTNRLSSGPDDRHPSDSYGKIAAATHITDTDGSSRSSVTPSVISRPSILSIACALSAHESTFVLVELPRAGLVRRIALNKRDSVLNSSSLTLEYLCSPGTSVFHLIDLLRQTHAELALQLRRDDVILRKRLAVRVHVNEHVERRPRAGRRGSAR